MALVANAVLVILSLLLGFRLFRQYSKRPRPHTLWFAVGLTLTAVAAFPELYRSGAGSLPTVLWWLYWSTGSALVGFLAVGTAYLVSQKFGHAALTVVCLLSLWVIAATVMTAGPSPEIFIENGTMAKAPTIAIKTPFLIQNILGSLVILGGALWSYFRTRALYNIWIAGGTLVFASGGAAAGLLSFPAAFYFTQTAGILLLYAGVSTSGKPRTGQVAQG